MVEEIEIKFIYKYENHKDLFHPIEATSKGFKEKGMISKPKFRFRYHLPAKVYRKILYIRRMGVLKTLKFKLGLSTPQEEFVMEEDR